MHKPLRIVKILGAALALLSTAVNAHAAETIFYEPSDYTAEGWTAQNATADNKWTIDVTTLKGTTNSGINNSWLFSPAFKLKGGVKYTISYEIKVNMSAYPVAVCNSYLLPEIKKSSTDAVVTVANTKTNGTTAVPVTATYTPENDITVYFAAQDKTEYGSKKGYIFFLRNFKIMADDGKTVPLAVTELTATADEGGANKVTLSWTNPSEMSDGSAAALSAVTISRGAEAVATLTDAEHIAAGAIVSYTDEVPAPGKYEYSIEVAAANGEKSQKATIASGYVGTFAALVPDYTFDLSDDVTNEHWTLATAGESNEWSIAGGVLQISVSNTKAIDATATTPAFQLDASKAYVVSYKQVASNPANKINLEFATGSAMGVLATVLDATAQVDSKTAVEKSFKFSPAATGKAYFGWHATAEKMSASYYTNTVKITDISIAEIAVLPRIATDVKAVAAADGSLAATVTWSNPTLSETGLPLGELKADIYRNGSMIAEGVEASGTYTDSAVPCAGFHTYKVVIRNASGATSEEPLSAKTDYVGQAFAIPFASDFAANPYAWATLAVGDADAKIAWAIDATGAKLTAKDNTMKHALLTPPLALSDDEVYELTVNAKASGYSDYKVTVYLLADGAAPDESNAITQATITSSAKDATAKFAVSEGGDYNIAYLIQPSTSAYGYDRTFTVNSLKVEQAPKIPALPQDIQALSTDDKKVELSWSTPALTPEGAGLTDDVTVRIYRGAEIADDAEPLYEHTEQPGVADTYTDETPAEGLNTYTFVFVYGEQQSETVAVESDYVGDAVSILYTSDFATAEGRAQWTIVDNSASYNKGTTFEYTDDNTLKVIDGTSQSSSSSKLDDWIISPVFTVYTGSNVVVEFEAKGYNGSSYYQTPYNVYLGKDKSVESLKASTKIGSGKLASADYTAYRHEFTPESTRADGKEKKVVGLQFGGTYSYPYVEVRSIKIDSDRRTQTGVESVAPDSADGAIWYDGMKVAATSAEAAITVYDTTGRAVAAARGEVSVADLTGGIYIVAATYEGKTTTLKIEK